MKEIGVSLLVLQVNEINSGASMSYSDVNEYLDFK